MRPGRSRTTRRNKEGNAVPPYYLSLKMPGQKEQTFSLTTTFTPNGRDNLGAFMAVDADASSRGLRQDQNAETADRTRRCRARSRCRASSTPIPDIAESISLLKGGDSEIEYGNLLTVPLDGGLLYVEPVYVRGARHQLPAAEEGAGHLRRADRLRGHPRRGAQHGLRQRRRRVRAAGDDGDQPGDDQPPPSERRRRCRRRSPTRRRRTTTARSALEKGDWEAYGKAQEDLKDALKRAADAEADRPRQTAAVGRVRQPTAMPGRLSRAPPRAVVRLRTQRRGVEQLGSSLGS